MTDWMQKLCKDFGVIADTVKPPTESIIKMPSPSLNWAMGNGGITAGKAVCMYGGESSGKSLLMQLAVAELHKQDSEAIAILFDSEYSFNPQWAKKLGVDLKRLIVRQSNDPVKIFDWIGTDLYQMVQDGAPVKMIAIDSVKAIRYPKDHKKLSTDQSMGGGGASYLGSALKMVLPVIREYEITTILVQQVYEEMDQYKKLNNPYIVPDGRALKHFADMMLEVHRIEKKDAKIEDGKNIHGASQQVGHKVRVKVKKNRVGAPYRTAEFSLHYEKGVVNTDEEIYELAKTLGVIFHPISSTTGKPSPIQWQFGDYEPIKGDANMKEWVCNNPHIVEEIYASCIEETSDEVVRKRNEHVSNLDKSDITEAVNINLDDL